MSSDLHDGTRPLEDVQAIVERVTGAHVATSVCFDADTLADRTEV